MKQLKVYITEGQHRRLKVLAAELGTTMSRLVEEMIVEKDEYIQEMNKMAEKER